MRQRDQRNHKRARRRARLDAALKASTADANRKDETWRDAAELEIMRREAVAVARSLS